MFFPRKQNNAVSVRNPFWEMDRLQRDMSRLFDLTLPGMSADTDAALFSGNWAPAVDVVDTKDAVLVKAELPGLTKDDIDVTIENGVLTIRGEKKGATEHKDGEYVRCERYYGTFYRAFTLPSSVNAEKVDAKFNNGVLELAIQKKEEARPRQVKIDVK